MPGLKQSNGALNQIDMPVLVTSSFDDDLFRNKQTSMDTTFFCYRSMGHLWTLKAANSLVKGRIWPKFEHIQSFM